MIIFLSISLNMRFGYSIEQSHLDGSFEYPQHMFWLRNKNNNFQLQTVIWRPWFHLRLRTKATTTAVQIISILAVFFFTNKLDCCKLLYFNAISLLHVNMSHIFGPSSTHPQFVAQIFH